MTRPVRTLANGHGHPEGLVPDARTVFAGACTSRVTPWAEGRCPKRSRMWSQLIHQRPHRPTLDGLRIEVPGSVAISCVIAGTDLITDFGDLTDVQAVARHWRTRVGVPGRALSRATIG